MKFAVSGIGGPGKLRQVPTAGEAAVTAWSAAQHNTEAAPSRFQAVSEISPSGPSTSMIPGTVQEVNKKLASD
ncbi:MAG: hypothetical protein ACRDIU_05760 [Actinomycetota bacterium]